MDEEFILAGMKKRNETVVYKSSILLKTYIDWQSWNQNRSVGMEVNLKGANVGNLCPKWR